MKYPLKLKHVNRLSYHFFGGKGWENKKQHCIRLANNVLKQHNLSITEKELQDFAKDLILWEKHYRSEMYKAKRTDNSKFPFETVSELTIGMKVHVSFLHKGAQFVVKKILGSEVLLDNPKYSRLKQGKQLLKVHTKDLRRTRKS